MRLFQSGSFAVALVLVSGIAGFAAAPAVLPEDTTVLRLNAPAGTQVTVDGRDFGQRRELKWTGLTRGKQYRSRLKLRFSDGSVVEREVSIRGGRSAELAVRSPTAQQPELVPQTGHAAGSVTTMDISPDGRLLVTGSDDCIAILWDIETRRVLRMLTGHALEISGVAFSPDGRYVATMSNLGHSGDDSHTAQAVLWDASTGQKLREFREPTMYSLGNLAFSPDGSQLVVTSLLSTGYAVVWDVQSGTRAYRVETKVEWPAWAAQPPKRTRQVAAGTGGAVITEQGREIATIPVTGRAQITSARFRPFSNQVVTQSYFEVALWDMATGEKQYALTTANQGRAREVTRFDVTDNGRFLSVEFYDEGWLFQAETGQRVGQLPNGFRSLGAGVSPDGTRQFAEYPDPRVLDIASGQALYSFKPTATDSDFPGQVFSGSVSRLTFSPDGSRIYSTANVAFGPDVYVWNAASGAVLHGISPDSDGLSRYFYTLAIPPDGSRLMARVQETLNDAEQWYMTLWDTRTGHLLKKTAVRHVEGIRSNVFSPGGTLMVESDTNELNALLWESAGPQLRHTFANVRQASFNADGSQLLTCGVDGVLRIYDTATLDEILALTLLENDEWLCMTPDGLFDGSPAARNRVAYRVAGQVVPVDRFFEDFYRPGLRAEVLGGARPIAEVEIGRSVPPTLKIVSPEGDAFTDETEATVLVEATDQGGGVDGPYLRHNGARVLAAGEKTREGKLVRQSFRVALIEGENRLRVEAASSDRSWESESAQVTLTLTKTLERPRLFVLAVGVDRYAEAGLSLSYAREDAEALAELFGTRGPQLYREVQTRVLVDEEATRASVTSTLAELAHATQAQDTLLVCFSGHGYTVGQRYYFIPHDFRTGEGTFDEAVRRMGLPMDELGDLLSAAAALKRVLVLDTCNSGAAIGRGGTRARNPAAFQVQVERLSRAQGVFTIAAAPASEDTVEVPDLRHGLLTYALLAGLKGVDYGPLAERAVRPNNPEQVVGVLDWFSFASGEVPGLARKYTGLEQDVKISGEGTSFPVLPLEGSHNTP